MPHHVYILAARPHGAIYIGRTERLRERVEEHRSGMVEGHTKKYGIHTLVWFEAHDTLEAALLRERQLKRWKRIWKDELIAAVNPEWGDMAAHIPL